MCRDFKRKIGDIAMRKQGHNKMGNLKRESQYLPIAARDNFIRTNYIKAKIDETQENSKYSLNGLKDKTVNHIGSECSKLGQTEYMTTHNWMGRVILWGLCKRLNFENTPKGYEHKTRTRRRI